MAAAKGAVESKYVQTEGRVFLSGNQALVRLVFEQSRRDRNAGLNTGGFVSGYRGSPMGHLDMDMGRVKKQLLERGIHFRSGVNEDLAATAVWGTQEVEFFGSKVDGVFGMWYSKGPGIDRSGDALRHANLWGTSPKGGVIMAVGDDPMSRSSSIQQQSEHTLASCCIPVFSAANVQDIYDYGLIGWQLSRYAGVWVAIKGVSDIYESWYPIDTDPARNTAVLPSDHVIEAPGVHTRWPDRSIDQDERMLTRRLPAVKAFIKANNLNKVTHGAGNRKLGIISSGKSWADVQEALRDLGIGEAEMADMGLTVFKVGVIWPLEPQGIQAFCSGLSQVLVVEECRPMLEPQVKDALYNLPASVRPQVLGKCNAEGREWLNSHGELTPVSIARTLAEWLGVRNDAMRGWLEQIAQTDRQLAEARDNVIRTPYFCSGCPHNSSTKVPEGSKQLIGIGCHYLVHLMDRDGVTFPHMGGEGGNWTGAALFSSSEHMFANVGDGTWYHSGSMAIRQAVSAKTNITFKILYNDAVAMTGGQPVDGPISVQRMLQSVQAEGVERIALVTANPANYRSGELPAGVSLHHRDELETVQKQLRDWQGVSVIVYEQTCATELRRRRGKKEAVDPQRRVFINDRICEGCGDCSVQSNCLSVQPLETEFGRKRVIDQSACNKDFSCLKGFCPSFVTIEGGALKKRGGIALDDKDFAQLPEPAVSEVNGVYGVMVTGIGGTGVVTIANLIGAAAQKEGKFTQALDLTGMAQKFGAVYCHLQISRQIDELHATRLSYGKANLLLGADLVVAASDESLSRLRPGVTRGVINSHETVTGAFTRDINFHLPITAMEKSVEQFCGEGRADFFDTTEIALALTGDTIGANMMLLGYACQKGWLPVKRVTLMQAIEDNGVAVPYNLKVFNLGRLLAVDPARIKLLAEQSKPQQGSLQRSETLEQVIDRRTRDLVAYQDEAYAQRYRAQIDAIGKVELQKTGQAVITEAVARNLYKLMAYKDEYEVARLYTDGTFEQAIADQFQGDFKLNFHFAPPLLSKIDPNTGRPQKQAFGPSMLKRMRWLASMKRFRGTALDVFGRSEERREERQLIADYEASIRDIVAHLSADNQQQALELANIPSEIRGFGPVKAANLAKVRPRWQQLNSTWKKQVISLVRA